jgi:hypothetical protein
VRITVCVEGWLYRVNELNQTLFLSNNTHSEASALAKAKAWWAWIVRFCDIGVIVNFETVLNAIFECMPLCCRLSSSMLQT